MIVCGGFPLGSTTLAGSIVQGLQGIETCPISPKYENDIIHLGATPKDGIGPYIVEFIKSINGVYSTVKSYIDAPENIQITYDYTLIEEDIRNALSGTINFSVYIEDSCPIIPQTCTETCTINIGCLAPVCNFTVT